jgi:GNAT superfamily N-acetyltransferase
VTDLRIVKLARHHAVEPIDCGSEPLSRFLGRYALQNQQANAAQTFVALSGDDIIGYHSLAVGEVNHSAAPPRLAKGLAQHPVPVMILARLGVHKDWHGKGIGAGLMKDAILRTMQAADIAGIRALIVHGKDDAARAFYAHFGFADGFSDPMHLYVLVKELRGIIERGAS